MRQSWLGGPARLLEEAFAMRCGRTPAVYQAENKYLKNVKAGAGPRSRPQARASPVEGLPSPAGPAAPPREQRRAAGPATGGRPRAAGGGGRPAAVTHLDFFAA